MKQVWITKAGAPDVLKVRETHDPVPKTGEVRIKVDATGVNFADILGRMGIYPDAPRGPYVPGYEVAGTVTTIGQGVMGLQEGDAVLALTRFGGYSDTVCVPYKQVFKRLAWMSANDGAAIPVNYLTAYMMLVVMGSVRKGNRVLIHGAAGGVGLAAIDICRILGAETFGTASPEKHEFVSERGLHHAIDYRNYDYEREVLKLTGDKGVDVILDPLGGVHWSKNYRLLRASGRVIHFGASSMATGKKRSLFSLLRMLPTLPFYSPIKLMNQNKAVMGVNLGHMWNDIDLMRPWMEEIIAWYDEALFRPHIDRIFTFEQAAEAHDYIQERQNIGKVLLTP